MPATATVHPRVCGERAVMRAAKRALGGSSPRVRGTHAGTLSDLGFVRFIPACAGNAQSLCSRGRRVTVHPRVCGERTT